MFARTKQSYTKDETENKRKNSKELINPGLSIKFSVVGD